MIITSSLGVSTIPEHAYNLIYDRSIYLVCSEADPLSGWNKPESWRADARYAAMVVKVTEAEL